MSTTSTTRSRRSPVLALVALAAAAVLIWLVFLMGDDDSDPAADGPAIVETGELSDAADRLGHPIYWVGERDGAKYELAESDSGRVYVRYLDEDAAAGVRSAKFLTIGTYPVKDGVAALRRAVKSRPQAELARSDDSAVMLIDPDKPGSVHLAYPGADLQVEVYSPDVEEGLRLVKAGDVQPVP